MPTIDQARAWYPAQDPVHGFDHVLRVLHMAEKIGSEVGADLEILRAAALLHDASGAAPGPGGGRATHEMASADFAANQLRREGWSEDRIDRVTHCIRSHRYRSAEAPTTLEARVLYDADKLDVLGAFGVARTIGYALQAGEPVFAEPSPEFQEGGVKQAGEAHSAYHEFLFKLRHVPQRLHTEPGRRIGAGRSDLMRRFFEQLAVEATGGDA
ncbi:MAG TPA: HD domain-containing protein [Anaerolineales bacterium]|nr:HD domain-containing protein [Anaerolineales bacterium]